MTNTAKKIEAQHTPTIRTAWSQTEGASFAINEQKGDEYSDEHYGDEYGDSQLGKKCFAAIARATGATGEAI